MERSEETATRARGWSAKGALALVAAALVIAGAAGWLAGDREAIRTLDTLGPVPFFAAMALLPAIGFPLTPFLLLAGAAFGRKVGLWGAWLSLAVNLVLCYALARHALRSWIQALLRRFGKDLPRFDPARKGALRFTLAVKATPGVPAFIKNYGLGVAGVPFSLFFTVSMVISGAYAAALVLFGESLFAHPKTRIVVVSAVVVALVIGLAVWLARRRARAA